MGIEQPLLLPKSHAGDSLKNPVKWNTKKDLTKEIIISNFEALGLNGAVFTAGKSGKMPYGQIKKYFRGNDVVINPGTPASTTTQKTEDLQFYYNPDHLGSSNYITDASGEVYQHQEYFPFGETFVEERNDAEYTTYLFNGKELDEETGLYYYGARYYDPRVSIFVSVDPHAENYYSWSPYHYAANNPIIVTDPNGKDWYTDIDGTYQYSDKVTSQKNLQKGQTYVGRTHSQLDKNGNLLAQYRKDGSIYFKNQKEAYNRMWQNANKYDREEFGVILQQGVLVLPSHHNNSGESDKALTDFGYSFQDNSFYDKVTNKNESFVATIHTHQNPKKNINVNVGFSSEDIYTFSSITPNKPFFAMEQNNTISAGKGSWSPRKDRKYYYEDVKHYTLKGLDGISLQKYLNGGDLRSMAKKY